MIDASVKPNQTELMLLHAIFESILKRNGYQYVEVKKIDIILGGKDEPKQIKRKTRTAKSK